MGTASPAASQGSRSAPDGSSDPPPPYSGPALSASRSPSPGPSRHGRLRDFKAVYPHWESMDPRSSSSQSLAPSEYSEPAGREGDGAQRRTLLIIYIHGFMGNDLSFRSFPAHIHSYLKAALAATHVIHSKIYPRYKTYKSIDVATAKFSTWLEPHESDTTDVILMGHSMGGILAADIALLRAQERVGTSLRHRILGTISLDSPFLGLHPGIIATGIASLFRPGQSDEKQLGGSQFGTPEPAGPLSPDLSIYSELAPGSGVTSPSGVSSPLSPRQLVSDPLFNPPFPNDVLFKDRGWWRNIAHFAMKHQSENLVEAAADHILSHLEFGGVLADYPALWSRYEKIRHLEDVDDLAENSSGPRREARVRFVNYYTLTSGLPARPKPLHEHEEGPHLKPESSAPPQSSDAESKPSSHTSTPRISIEDHGNASRQEIMENMEPELDTPMQYVDPMPMTDEDDGDTRGDDVHPDMERLTLETATTKEGDEPSAKAEKAGDADLPSIPDLPARPELPDLGQITDKEERKQAERASKAAQKAYDQAVKSRDKLLKDRDKLMEKQRRKAAKEAEQLAKAQQKRERDEEKRLAKEAAAAAKAEAAAATRQAKEAQQQEKQKAKEERKLEKKERKFCMTPRRGADGRMDPTWVPVHMHDIDEVSAHTTIFCPEPHYETLVGDVCERIVAWVHEDASKRALLASMRE